MDEARRTNFHRFYGGWLLLIYQLPTWAKAVLVVLTFCFGNTIAPPSAGALHIVELHDFGMTCRGGGHSVRYLDITTEAITYKSTNKIAKCSKIAAESWAAAYLGVVNTDSVLAYTISFDDTVVLSLDESAFNGWMQVVVATPLFLAFFGLLMALALGGRIDMKDPDSERQGNSS